MIYYFEYLFIKDNTSFRFKKFESDKFFPNIFQISFQLSCMYDLLAFILGYTRAIFLCDNLYLSNRN